MNSRRYELQKKKQAVRRLSGGNKPSFYADLADLRKKVASSGNDNSLAAMQKTDKDAFGNVNPFQTFQSLDSSVKRKSSGFSSSNFASQMSEPSVNPFSASTKAFAPIFPSYQQSNDSSTDLATVTSSFGSTPANPFDVKVTSENQVKPSASMLQLPGQTAAPIFGEKLPSTTSFSTKSDNPFEGRFKPLRSFTSTLQTSEEKKTPASGTKISSNLFGDSQTTTDSSALSVESNDNSNPFAKPSLLKSSQFIKASFGELIKPSRQLSSGLPFDTSNEAKIEKPVSFAIKSTGQLSSAGEKREKRFQTSSKSDTKSEVDASTTALRLKGVPSDLLDKTFLKNFYAAFGDVKRVFIHPQTSSAILTFSTHEAAASAKDNGRVLKEGYKPISIFWKAEKSTANKAPTSKPVVTALPTFLENAPTREMSSSSIIKLVEDFVSTINNIQCRTASEKLEILEKIDQKIREGLKKETDISKAKVTRGTCPDICPEKERYLREDRRRLASYEVMAGTENANTLEGEFSLVDHNKAVKEYSRSSADQEEPLSHELRPVQTLTESMNYIIWNVLDTGNSNWADWYDYVWNRTRAIRKDITQQNLKCGQSVQLMEQCARFHIVCAHLLCEEDVNVFDSKINNENLTKCLQSLKQMYYDLLHDKNEVCQNEAEFRAYQVLLNLNDGNILCEVMTFRTEILQSPQVKFALSVYSALNNKNYVRFLHLLRHAPYLVACLMHRYINQIRAMGLRVMNKAYNQPSSRPLKDIARLLVFDSEDVAAEFCQHYSLICQAGSAIFSKSSFLESEQAFRSIKCEIITTKRNSLIGQIVHGEPFPSNFVLTPQSVSFNENGTYNGTYHQIALRIFQQKDNSSPPLQPIKKSVTFKFNSPFLQQEMPLQQITTTQQPQQPLQQAGLPHYSAPPTYSLPVAPLAPAIDAEAIKAAEQEHIRIIKENIKDICKGMLLEAVDYNVKTAAAFTMTCVHEVRQQSLDLYRDILLKVVEGEVTEVSRRTHLLEKRREVEFQKNAISKFSTEIENSIVDSVTCQLTQKIATNVYQKEFQKSESDRRDCVILQLSNEMIDSHVSNAVNQMSHDVINTTREARKEDLIRKQKIIELESQKKIFNTWWTLFTARQQLKASLEDFPPAPPSRSVTRSIAELTGEEIDFGSCYDTVNHSVALPDGSVLTCETTESLSRKRKRHKQAVEDYHRRVKMERDAWSNPLCLSDLIIPKKRLSTKLGQILWKVSVSFPDESLQSCWCKRIRNKLGLGRHDRKFTSSIQLDSIVIKDSLVVRSNIEEYVGAGCDSYGSSGLVYVLDLQKVSWKMEKKRFRNFIDSRPCLPLVPVLILAIDDEHNYTSEDIHSLLNLDNSHFDTTTRYLSIHLLDIYNDPKSFELEIKNCLQDLFDNQPTLPLLEWDTLSTYVEKGIVSFYKGILLEPSSVNSNESEPLLMVDLYNHIIHHLIEVATTAELSQISWPPPQLTNFFQQISTGKPFTPWNSKHHFSLLSNALNQLILPDIIVDPTEGSWEEQLDICIAYLQQIDINLHQNAKSSWSQLLNRVLSVISKAVSLPRSRSSCLAFPWSNVISECIFHTLDYFCSSELYHIVNQSCNVVFYRQVDFDSFHQPSSLLTLSYSNREASFDERSSLGELSRSAKINAFVAENDAELDKILKKQKKVKLAESSTTELNKSLEEFENELTAFKENLHIQRFQNSKFNTVADTPSFDMDAKQRKLTLLYRHLVIPSSI